MNYIFAVTFFRFAPTCPLAGVFGAPHLVEKRPVGAAPSTCPGQMEPHAAHRHGVSNHNAFPRVQRPLVLRGAGEAGVLGHSVLKLVGEAYGAQRGSVQTQNHPEVAYTV